MTAEQVRHQFHVGPRKMGPETWSALDPYQRRPVANGLPLSDPAVLKRHGLRKRVIDQRHRIRLPLPRQI